MNASRQKTPRPPVEQKPLIDEFNDFVLLMMDGRSWTAQQRNMYNKLHRKIEAVSQ
jgi:hypothetical protein